MSYSQLLHPLLFKQFTSASLSISGARDPVSECVSEAIITFVCIIPNSMVDLDLRRPFASNLHVSQFRALSASSSLTSHAEEAMPMA